MQFREYALKAVDTIFKLYGQTVTVTYSDTTTADITVVHRSPDKITDFMDSLLHSASDMFEVKKSDAVLPISQIVLDGKTYTAQGEPVLDQYGLVLKVEAVQ